MGSSAGKAEGADAVGGPADGCAAAPAPGVVTLTSVLEGALAVGVLLLAVAGGPPGSEA